MIMNRKRLFTLTTGLLTLFWSLSGFAGTFSAKPASDDMILGILSTTIGPIIHHISGVGNGTDSVITTALKDINTLVLILGGLLLTYVIGSGIMKTAHEGEALGQKWSSMWIPLKAAIGAALILPIPSLGGLSAAQGIVVWLLTFGIGAADGLWEQSIQFIAKDPVGSVVVSPMNTAKVAAGIMSSQVCERAINETADNYFPGSNPISRSGVEVNDTLNPLDGAVHALEGYQETVSPLPGTSYDTQYSHIMWTADSSGLLGDLSSMGFLPKACGSVAFVSGTSGAIGQNSSAAGTLISTVGADNTTAMTTLVNALSPISQNVYAETGTGTNDAAFVNAVNAYDGTMQTDIQNAANTAVQSQVQKYESAARLDGFATAGEWFWDLVQWNHIAQNMADSLGDTTGLDFGSALGKLGSSHVSHANARIESFIKRNGNLVGNIKPSQHVGSVIGGIFAEATPMLVSAVSHSSSNPLIAIRNVGTGMEDAGATVFALGTGVTFAAATANGNGIEKVAAGEMTNGVAKVSYYELDPIMIGLAGLLFVEGFFLSFVVPLIPFMVWISGLLGFLFMAFEMIVAAPIWAIMHMHPEGHEVAGLGAQGYKFALAIVARPFLMILGLLGGYALFMGFSALVTPMISQAVISSQGTGGGWTGPLDMIGAVGVYVTFMVIIAYECFKLVFVLPGNVMAWATASANKYSDDEVLNQQKGAHGGAKNKAENISRAVKKPQK